MREERGWDGVGSVWGEEVTPLQKVLTCLSLSVPSRRGREEGVTLGCPCEVLMAMGSSGPVVHAVP